MAKIRGKFAPLTEELGNDERFILGLNDLEKLMYILIVYTCHLTRHQAPSDPKYYITRYGLSHRLTAVRHALDKCLATYPQLVCTNKKLSLLNSPTYKSQISLEVEEEREEEREREGLSHDRLSDWKKIEEEYPNKASIKNGMRLFFECEMLQAETVLKAIVNYKAHLKANPWKQKMNIERFLKELDAWTNHIEPEKEESDAERDARILAKLKK